LFSQALFKFIRDILMFNNALERRFGNFFVDTLGLLSRLFFIYALEVGVEKVI